MKAAIVATIAASGCSSTTDSAPAGDVTIAIQQSLTGQTTSAGSFVLSGAISDDGQTTEELTFGAPLNTPVVPITFRRVLTGRQGTMTVKGSASLTWTSQTAGTLSGTWQVESATGLYSSGSGTFSGSANFAATPPTSAITYVGKINR